MRKKLNNLNSLPKELFVVFFLSIVSAIPLVLTSSTLTIWLARYGIERKTIAFFSIISLPYSLKFLWSFIFDYFNLPKISFVFGRYISWLLFLAFGVSLGIYILSFSSPDQNLLYIAIVAFIVNLFSASFDIVLDAYRIKNLSDNYQGLGATAATYGYRLGMLTASSGALILTEYFSWQIVYSYLSLVIFVISLLSCIFIRNNNAIKDNEVERHQGLKNIYSGLIIKPFHDFMKRDKWIVIILFIILFKISDAMLATMANKFYVETGFSNKEIALVIKSFGFIMTMIGTIVGGYLTYKMRIMNFLKISIIIQSLSNLSYLIIIYTGPNISSLFITIAIENLSGAASTIAIIAYLSSVCNKNFAATQYALLSSLSSIGRVLFSIPTGVIVDELGWSSFFVVTTILGLPAYFLVDFLNKKRKVQ